MHPACFRLLTTLRGMIHDLRDASRAGTGVRYAAKLTHEIGPVPKRVPHTIPPHLRQKGKKAGIKKCPESRQPYGTGLPAFYSGRLPLGTLPGVFNEVSSLSVPQGQENGGPLTIYNWSVLPTPPNPAPP